MKESFIFYKSFMDAVETIPQAKYRSFLLESIIKLGLFSDKSEEKFISFCKEIEQKLSKNLQVLGLFLAIKPQLFANYKKYMRKLKKDNTSECEAYKDNVFNPKNDDPRSSHSNEPRSKQMNNETMNNETMNNDLFFLNEKNEQKKQKKLDPFISNSIVEKFQSEHERILGNKPYLTAQQRMKIMELNSEIPEFIDTITTAFLKVKNINFDIPNFKPNGGWLLKEDNYTNVLNGMYDKCDKKEESKDWTKDGPDWYVNAKARLAEKGIY